jgi:PhzF family phenazine biosynthesis protein
MEVPVFVVDAFTDRPFSGNPAAVCLLDGPAPDAWMQRFAAEMNLSETAFLHRESNVWRLRWFTPAVEVDLCGHATLASAHVLASEGVVPRTEPEIRFETRSGTLTATASGETITMDFPSTPAQPAEPPESLLAALAPDLSYRHIVGAGTNGVDWLIQLADEASIRSLSPDFRALAAENARGVIVTSRAGEATRADYPEADFVSRFFGPAVGVDEDPVTGSAHCTLGPWWAERLGKRELEGRQVSERGGTVRIHCRRDRVSLSGRAVTIVAGRVRVGVTRGDIDS